MKCAKAKLGLTLAATLVVGFVGGFASKSCLDFLRPTITTAYSCVTPISPVASALVAPGVPVFPHRTLLPVNYGGFFEPLDLQLSPFDLNDSFSQVVDVPSIRTEDTGKELRLVANLPGIEPKNVQVDIQSNFITIKGNQTDKKGDHIVKSASFVRSMNLPGNVDSRRAQQDFRDGVLTISIPKIDLDNAQRKSKPSMTSASI
jgi:HSP20 family protein